MTLTTPYWLGVTEVTNAQYEAVMGANPSPFRGPNRPVVRVSWDDAVAFCAKLAAKESGVTYRLPTEAEWEYACRAGSPPQYYWHWSADLGNDLLIDDYAWYSGSKTGGGAHGVGRKKPNHWGLHDMSGNVREWCSDWYGEYGGDKQIDPTGAASGSSRVLSGGSWDDSSEDCRSAARSRFLPSDQYDRNGFRLVRMVR